MTRSEIMKRIKSKGNKSTELAYASYLRRKHIIGWRRHQKVEGIDIDFVFKKSKTAVFVDGCFWHACRPHANVQRLAPFWRDKVLGNARRDRRQERILKALGWFVCRVWEHDLKEII